MTVLSGRYILRDGNLSEKGHMQPEHHTNLHAAALGSLGGLKRRERLTSKERSTISRLAAIAHWHPLEVQAEKEKAQEQAYLIEQILNNGKQASSSDTCL